MAEASGIRSIEQIENNNDFLAMVSHELRAPIMVILGWVELLGHELGHQEIVARAVEVIKRNAQAQAQLIDELLDYSRIAANKFSMGKRVVSLGSIVKAAIVDFTPIARDKHIEIEMDLNSLEDAIVGDSLRLHQVFSNLLSNAIKFSAPGGYIKVKFETVNGSHNIVVGDSGEGITSDFLPFVFDRYRQAERHAGGPDGLGIGLTIARHIVELHGGTIEAYSRGKGQGAAFTVKLPRAINIEIQQMNERDLPILSRTMRDPVQARVLDKTLEKKV